MSVSGAESLAASTQTGTRWVPVPLCAKPKARHWGCMAMRLTLEKLKVKSTAKGSFPKRITTLDPNVTSGPAGGYTPRELATAYGVNVSSTLASNQTVGIVDASDDPTVLSDLNAFDSQYGIAAETATSFRVVNQTGGSTLPAANSKWAGEIGLDVQAVRGLCRKCKILLVEADTNSWADLATAENEAVTLGANEVSNSYGGPETDPQTQGTIAPAYNHPGVAILASTGDDGWYGWDRINPTHSGSSDNSPSVPATFNTVIGVGGTSLYLNSDNTRLSETVWNDNGPNDYYGWNIKAALGASGSGCSALYASNEWQRSVPGYSGLGCGTTLRSGVDIAADADPFTGYDVFQTYAAGGSGRWVTYGGTSLAAPLIAAMWALAGGPGGVSSPQLSLYGHFHGDAVAPTYDVLIGGTGSCDTSSPVTCFQWWGGNPNTLGFGDLDCAWGASGTTVLANRYQCYARPGYDGVSGIGTPNGVAVFKPDNPTAKITAPASITHGQSASFSASGSTDPFPGGAITKWVWKWGDGTTSTPGTATTTHTYAAAGTYTVTLTVTDNYARTKSTSVSVTVS